MLYTLQEKNITRNRNRVVTGQIIRQFFAPSFVRVNELEEYGTLFDLFRARTST